VREGFACGRQVGDLAQHEAPAGEARRQVEVQHPRTVPAETIAVRVIGRVQQQAARSAAHRPVGTEFEVVAVDHQRDVGRPMSMQRQQLVARMAGLEVGGRFLHVARRY
jgi:hypothetical protein